MGPNPNGPYQVSCWLELLDTQVFLGSVQCWRFLGWYHALTKRSGLKDFSVAFKPSSSYNHPHNDGVFVSSWFIQSIDQLASCLAIKNAVKLGWYPAIRTVRRMSYTPEVLMDGYSTITSLKINMEHQNHQIEKEHHLPNLHFFWVPAS